MPLRNGIVGDPLENMSKLNFRACTSVAQCGNSSLTEYFPIIECVRALSQFKTKNIVNGVSQTSWCLKRSHLLICSSRTIPFLKKQKQKLRLVHIFLGSWYNSMSVLKDPRTSVKAGAFWIDVIDTVPLGIPPGKCTDIIDL